MSRHIRKIYVLIFSAILVIISSLSAFAASSSNDSSVSYYNNETTGYEATVIDDAHLFMEFDREDILNDAMKNVTEYAHVVLATIDKNPCGYSEYSTEYERAYCSMIYDAMYEVNGGKYENCIIFLIDMDSRWLYLYREGDIKSTITEGICDTITDNIYSYASSGDYKTCSKEAFSQAYKVLDGYKINAPMKVICNIFIALSIGFLITCIYATSVSSTKQASKSEVLGSIYRNIRCSRFNFTLVNTTKVYVPPSSSSSSSGGGGGGGSHGGGGGHRF